MNLSVRGLAARQLADYRACTPGTFFAEEDHPRLSLEDAYAIQGEVARLRAAEGELVAGYKVGCTGPNVREQFGMDGPVRGFLYETELYPSGAKLSYASYANLAIEGELAVRLGDDAEIARVFPVIELHNYVFRSKSPNLQELIANNGLHAGVVLPDTEGVQWCGEEPLDGALRVEINGRTVEEGPMSGVPGGPAGSMEWLRRHLAAYGLALRPQQLVLTGTPLGLIPIRPGDSVRVTAEGLGSVEATVVA
ncbi:MAG: fumarylacetoacetate hydrolase family protein [Actinomycetota bacterium]|nr:fumarylacetoacetate hydrolase family protein [Actinomycetota bacterium]